jgi:hypothetical protein
MVTRTRLNITFSRILPLLLPHMCVHVCACDAALQSHFGACALLRGQCADTFTSYVWILPANYLRHVAVLNVLPREHFLNFRARYAFKEGRNISGRISSNACVRTWHCYKVYMALL